MTSLKNSARTKVSWRRLTPEEPAPCSSRAPVEGCPAVAEVVCRAAWRTAQGNRGISFFYYCGPHARGAGYAPNTGEQIVPGAEGGLE